MRKTEIGKLYSFKFPKRKSAIQGIVLDYNKDWTIIKHVVDYRIDGFTVFQNEKAEYIYGEAEKFATKILKIKDYSWLEEPTIPLESLDSILKYVDENYQLIQLDTKDGEACDIVKYKGLKENLYLFDALTTRAKWTYKLVLPLKEIRYISFGNDYVNSLKLVTKFKKQQLNKPTVFS